MLVNLDMHKAALHAHDRGLERLNLPKESVDSIQKAVDRMWYSHGRKKLTGDNYYSKLKDRLHNDVGYAAFKKVGPPTQERLILATILSNGMKPRGQDISSWFTLNVKGSTPKVPNQPLPYTGMTPIPDNGHTSN